MSNKPMFNLLVVLAFLVALLPVPAVLAAPPAQAGSGATISSHPSASSESTTPPQILADVDLILDDGSNENDVGVNDDVSAYQFIWLNRFTPDPGAFPFNLDQIQVFFDTGVGVAAGDAIDLVVYEDADGDPSNGATLLATINETVQFADGANWSVYDLAAPVTLNGPGDVLIGAIDRFVTSGVTAPNYPAAIDTTSSQGRSWIGWWVADPPDPADLPPDLTFGTIDSLGLPGNWLIRGFGSNGGGPPCNWEVVLAENFDGVTPADLPAGWHTVPVVGTTPVWATNAGTVHPSGQAAHSEPNLVYFNSWTTSSGNSARLYYDSAFDFTDALEAQVSFWMYHDMGYTSADRVQVQVSTDGGTTWTDAGAPVNRYDGSTDWAQHTVNLSGYVGMSGVMLGFLGISAYGNDIHLDDIQVEGCFPPPSCDWAVVMEEHFESWPPAGWTVVDNGGCGVWNTNDYWGRTNYAGGDGMAADADADACGSAMDTELWSPPLNLSAALEASLSFIAAYNYLSGDFFEVNVSPDGGVTWDTLLHWTSDYSAYGPGELVELDLTPYVGLNNVIVSFHYMADSWDWYAEVDQVVVSGCFKPSLIMEPEEQMGMACMGGSANYEFTVTNQSGASDTFDATALGNTWETIVDPATFSLAPEESATLNVTVNVPPYVFSGDSDGAIIEVVSQANPEAMRSATVSTYAGNVWLPSDEGGMATLWPAYASDGTSLFYMDGKGEDGLATDRVQVYTPGMGWDMRPGDGAALYGSVAGYAADGLIYVGGGFEDGQMGTYLFQAYDPVTSGWTPLAPMPEGLGLGAGGVSGDQFVWVGGSPNAALLAYTPVYVYDIATDSWTAGTALMDVGFTAPGYAVAGGMVYVGGNWLGTDLFYAYDVAADTWTQLADLPTDAGKVSPLFIYDGGDEIYLVAGGTAPSQATNAVYRYVISQDAWYEETQHPIWPTLGNGGGLLGGHLYTFGGGMNTGAAQAEEGVGPHEFSLVRCPDVDTGILSGYVKNGVTNDPIEGALVEAEGTGVAVNEQTTPFAYTDANGYYELVLYAPATYDITASCMDFDPKLASVTVSLVGTSQDFTLGPAVANPSPTSYSVELPWGDQAMELLTIANDGYSTLEFELAEQGGGYEPAPLSIPAIEGDFSQDPATLSLGMAPEAEKNRSDEAPITLLSPGNPAYGVNLLSDSLYNWPDIDVPGTWNLVGSMGAGAYYAGDFAGNDLSQLYVIDNDTQALLSVNTATGAATPIGACTPNPGQTWTGMAWDPTTGTMYASATDGVTATLFTVNLSTGAATAVGTITGAPLTIDIAVDNGGQMYSVDISLGQLMAIDKTTGAATPIGSLGYSANYAQGLDYDAAAGILYWAAYYSSDGQLRVIDTSTGASAYVGAFPGSAEVDAFAIASSGGGPTGAIPWLTEDPVTGTIPMLGSVPVDLSFDTLAVAEYGTYTGTLILNSNDPANPAIEMPVEMIVTDNPNAGLIQGTVTSDRPGGPLKGAMVHLVGPGGFDEMLTTDAAGYYEIMVPPANLGDFDITASAADYLDDVQTVPVGAGTTVHDVELELVGPWVGVDPTVLEQTLLWGDSVEDYIEITNSGNEDLDYNVTMPLDVLLWEEFESWPPAGWTIVDNGGNCVWMSSADYGRTNYTGGAGDAADADSDACGSGTTMNTDLYSPILDLSGAIAAQLSFKYEYNNLSSSEQAALDISPDSGATWVNIFTWNTDHLGPATYVVDLTPFLGGSGIVMRWHYYAPGWDWWWEIDDVLVEAAFPADWLAWTPTSGTIVPGGADTLTLTKDAGVVPMPGVYTAELLVENNDPLETLIPISITMNVVNNPDQGHLYGTVLGSRTAEGIDMPLEGAHVMLDGPYFFETWTDENGEYEFYLLPPQVGNYVVYVEMPGYIMDVSVLLPVGPGDSIEHNVTLRLLASWLMVDPEAIAETLPWDGSTTIPMTVMNPPEGTGRLQASMLEIMPTFTPMVVQTAQIDIGASPATVLAEGVVLDDRAAPAAPVRTVDVSLLNLSLQPLKVLILSDDANQGALDGLDIWLNWYPDLDVEVWYSSDGFPTLADLLPYQAIIVGGRYAFSNAGAEWTAEALGNLVADYVDAGGGVIMIQNAWLIDDEEDAQYALGGRFEAELSPVDYQYSSGETYTYADRALGFHLAGHPLMEDVGYIVDHVRAYTDLMVRPYAESVAYYDDGEVYVTATPGKVVLLNQVLTYQWNWEGDVPTLVHNAIMYLAPTEVPWLDETVTEFDLPVGSSAATEISLDASVPEVDQPGIYGAWLWFANNDPLQQGAYVPVEMTVEPDPTMGVLMGTVTMDRHESGLGMPAEGATILMTTPHGEAEVKTDANGHYVHYFTAAEIGAGMPVDLMALYPEYSEEYASGVMVYSGQETVQDFEVHLMAPWIHVSPHALEIELAPDTQGTLMLDIENAGMMPMEIPMIQEIPATATLPIPAAPSMVTWVEQPFTVDAEVANSLQAKGATTDFFIWMRERADLSHAYSIVNKDLRREFVFETLTQTADHSQMEIRKYLDSRGLDYEVFWINNSILVHGGDLAIVDTMRARGDVYRIRGVYTQMSIPDPEHLAIVTLDENSITSDPTWNIDIVNAPEVWEQLNATGEGVVVSNIDTGVRYTHEALNSSYRGNLGSGVYDHNYNWGSLYGNGPTACPGSPEAPCDWAGHGSHTMGTMIGGDGTGPFDMDIGMAPDAQWMACMGCDTPPNGCSDAALTGCAQWVVAPLDLDGNNPDPSMAPDVVNNSWGGGGEDDWYYSYVEAWQAADIIPVFSAGNEGPGCITMGSPGSYDNVIGMGGTDNADNNYTYTSRGPGSGTGVFPVQKPDLAAPAEGVPSSVNTSDNAYANYSGTSMAAPHMCGLAALMLSVDPTLTFDEIWEIATANTVTETLNIKNGTWCGAGPEFPNYVFGYGRIDAFAAVSDVSAEMDIPWLSLDPVSGTVPAAGTMPVEVTFDATGLEDGVYTGTLRVLHDDPLTGEVLVPVTMIVETPMAALYIDKMVDPTEQYPGELVTFTIVFGNEGTGAAMGAVMTDMLPEEVEFVDAEPAGWIYDPDTHEVAWTVDLAPGAEIEATIWVRIADDATQEAWLTNHANLTWEAISMPATAPVYVLKEYYLYLPLIFR